jgi:hypothetical protein
MTNLVATLAAVLHATVPSVSVDRVNAIAEDMVSVVEAEHTSDKRLDSASSLAMLAAVAIHESGLRESVENCKAAGDGGKSIGLGQVMRGPNWEGHTRQEICSSRKLQLQLALHTIDRCNTKGRSMESVFRCYTSGNPSFDSAAARSEHKLFLNLRSSIRETAKRNEKLEVATKADRSVEVPGA